MLSKMKEDGWKVPAVPVVYIRAANEKEAKEKVLLLTSQYGHYTQESLFDFIKAADLDWGSIEGLMDFPQLDMDLPAESPTVEEGPEPQFDKAEELRVKYDVKLGQVWQLGDHRVMCGDATKAVDVGILLHKIQPFLMIADPPYGVQYNPGWRTDAPGLFSTPRRTGKITSDDRFDWREAYSLFCGAVAYIWHSDRYDVVESVKAAGFEIRCQIIWVKQMKVFARGHYHWQHEPCWYAVKRGQTAKWNGDQTQSTVWEIRNANPLGGGHDDADTNHGAQKPVECMARPIKNHGGKDDHVYDPFLGSGTTLIACEQLQRRCFGMEISPAYTAVSIQRWVDLTHKTPQLMRG